MTNNNSNLSSNYPIDTPNNAFDTIESVELIYPAETIDIVECAGAQAIDIGTTIDEPDHQAANDALIHADIYALDSARRAKFDRSLERRATKSRLTDRRAQARLGEDGEPQPDRRVMNRLANIDALRLSKE